VKDTLKIIFAVVKSCGIILAVHKVCFCAAQDPSQHYQDVAGFAVVACNQSFIFSCTSSGRGEMPQKGGTPRRRISLSCSDSLRPLMLQGACAYHSFCNVYLCVKEICFIVRRQKGCLARRLRRTNTCGQNSRCLWTDALEVFLIIFRQKRS
jgi:hypothetical protein